MHHDTSCLNNSAGISEERLYAACTHITYVLLLPQILNLNQTMRKLSDKARLKNVLYNKRVGILKNINIRRYKKWRGGLF